MQLVRIPLITQISWGHELTWDFAGTVDTRWIIPSTHTSQQLQESLDVLKQHIDSPPTFDDGMSAEDFIGKKPKPRAKAFDSDSGDDDDDDDDDDELEMMFEPGGPTAMKPIGERKKKKLAKKARKRDEPDDEQRAERRAKRLQREKEKLAAIKSDKFVHDSDDESDVERDEAFFEKERRLRLEGPKHLYAAGGDAPQLDFMTYDFGDVARSKKRKMEDASAKGKERKRRAIESDDEGEDEDMMTQGEGTQGKPANAESDEPESDSEDGNDRDDDDRDDDEKANTAESGREGEDEGTASSPKPIIARRRPVIVDSDSE